ncbi:BAH domain-containing protein [Colletotrichum scovillei]|uniref:BAH domain-containing protein n=1 Tax=Colletotrichum scovillei TaxID=1209932 RepID=A0A9P7UF13_9PEZI|nr:BAH domain-containing protein [Colletotrichum scovillei]KAF4782434.1 BAH domain-containing protein [Colletotrichum scovillei]KAG7050207.1 BAH domain-containing protein [Colletotrichum scovillei]KAG7069247.1 BAH domain-containing protein [Colletotrichum scovillei]KAG7073194.1 BAH domain-containing protein [Colletotrichum scovillei]
MSTSRKRPRAEVEENKAECPFSITYAEPDIKAQKKSKKRRKPEQEEEDGKKSSKQLSPFSPSGDFNGKSANDVLDLEYHVHPQKKWLEMTRYNSFVLNGTKYFSEGFIYVANDQTVQRQKAAAEGSTDANEPEKVLKRSKSEDDWVARILEIRASDEHHVYARIYWMYWPEELPEGTMEGKRYTGGRQPYHGHNELIASNHMDIINVVSVTLPATVKQWIEENDDEIQEALYWRQAFDCRTQQLSSVERTCKCRQPANPDKTLVGCSNKECGKWLHEHCLREETLMRTYERLGKDKPHFTAKPPTDGTASVAESDKVKEEKPLDDGVNEPLSPTESGADVKQTIDAKPSDALEETNGQSVTEGTPAVVDERVSQPPTTPATPTVPEVSAATSSRKVRSFKKKPTSADVKPWEGLFEARILMDMTPSTIEIRDLRENVTEGEKVWTEPLLCVVCGVGIS